MTPEQRRIWLQEEEFRITKYQHQHRGLNFLKLYLPPTDDRKVNLVGLDNHIYRGSIPRVPEDQLPPEIDEDSINEEALYKEIKEMSFPPVPENEPLGPSRRIGGSYTLAKKLILAPVHVSGKEKFEETLILGKDGKFYRGTEKYPSSVDLDKSLRGTKRPVRKMRQASSARGFVEPTLISLQTETQYVSRGRDTKSSIKLPVLNARQIKGLIKNQNAGKKVTSETESLKDKAKHTEQQPEKSKDASPTEDDELEEPRGTEENDDSEQAVFFAENDELEESKGTEGSEDSEPAASSVENDELEQSRGTVENEDLEQAVSFAENDELEQSKGTEGSEDSEPAVSSVENDELEQSKAMEESADSEHEASSVDNDELEQSRGTDESTESETSKTEESDKDSD